MADRDSLTAQRLRELLHYDPELGWFMWRVRPSRRTWEGSCAGSLHKGSGYVRVVVDGTQYLAHRLAVLYMTGEWPKHDEVDHEDTVRSNNHWLNLRDVPMRMNRQNMRCAQARNKTGLLGVTKIHEMRFKAGIGDGTRGRKKHLGYFRTAQKAHEAYLTEKRRIHAGNTL